MRPLMILLCLASTAVGEDYRWHMVGDKGEEFELTLFGTTSSLDDNGEVGRYRATDWDLQWSIPYELPPTMDLLDPPSVSIERLGTLSSLQIRVADQKRNDVEFIFYKEHVPAPFLSNFEQPDWQLFQFGMRTRVGPSSGNIVLNGDIVSISRIPIPEPSSFPLLMFAACVVICSARKNAI